MSVEAKTTLPTFIGTDGTPIEATGPQINAGGYAQVYPGRVGEIDGVLLRAVQVDMSDEQKSPFNETSKGSRFRRGTGRHFWAPVIYDGVIDGGMIMQALNQEGVPGIPQVHGVYEPSRAEFVDREGPLRGTVVVAMEHIKGKTLRENMDLLHSSYSLPEVVAFLDKLAPTLDALHAPSTITGRDAVVHFDVKPENILNDAEGNVYLVDFDQAMQVRDIPAQTPAFKLNHVIPVAPGYMAPECYLLAAEDAGNNANMPITTRADMFSVAVVALEMLTEKTVQELAASYGIDSNLMHVADDLTYEYLQFGFQKDVAMALHKAGYSDEVVGVFQKALAFDPRNRFATVREFSDALRSAA